MKKKKDWPEILVNKILVIFFMNNLVFFDDTIDIFSTFIVFVLGGYLINILVPSDTNTKIIYATW